MLFRSIAPENIAQARQQERALLQFAVHDMRQPIEAPPFDAVLNLFTSFGYFDNESEHQAALHTMASALKPNGVLVIDYLNVDNVRANLVPLEEVEINRIRFTIRRKESATQFIKEITVEDPAMKQPLHFEETVAKFQQADFERMLSKEDLKIRAALGDYSLNAYDPVQSPRLILIAERR